MLYGHREFVCLIGSDEGHACDMLDSIKTELDSNEMLLADFPEVCFPIQALDGISNRANGQLWPERFNYDELSAIQHAMNLKLQDEAAFFAEYQNQPLPEETVADGMLKANEVAANPTAEIRHLLIERS